MRFFFVPFLLVCILSGNTKVVAEDDISVRHRVYGLEDGTDSGGEQPENHRLRKRDIFPKDDFFLAQNEREILRVLYHVGSIVPIPVSKESVYQCADEEKHDTAKD
jgi:hypothetical protein